MINRRSQSVRALTLDAQPQGLWTLYGLPPASALRLERWLDALHTIPTAEWIRIGEQRLCGDGALLTATSACSHIERAIEQQNLHVTAWLVRDSVETTVFGVRQTTANGPRRIRAHIAIARMAAEWAALAIATEAWIPRVDVETMCAPFETIAEALADSAAS